MANIFFSWHLEVKISRVLQVLKSGVNLVHRVIRPMVIRWAQSDWWFRSYGVLLSSFGGFSENSTKQTEKPCKGWTISPIELIFSANVLSFCGPCWMWALLEDFNISIFWNYQILKKLYFDILYTNQYIQKLARNKMIDLKCSTHETK